MASVAFDWPKQVKGESRFKEDRSRSHLLTRRAVKSHCKVRGHRKMGRIVAMFCSWEPGMEFKPPGSMQKAWAPLSDPFHISLTYFHSRLNNLVKSRNKTRVDGDQGLSGVARREQQKHSVPRATPVSP